MIPHFKNRAWPIAVVAMLIATNTSIMGGQPDPDEMVFMPPNVAPTVTPSNPARPLYVAVPTPRPPNKNVPSGKANVARSNVATPPKSSQTFPATVGTNRTDARPSDATVNARASGVRQISATGNDSGVTTAAHSPDPMMGVTPDGDDPILLKERRKRSPTSIPLMTSPTSRGAVPGVRGALLGLSGETATERLLQMRDAAAELDRENEELRQQNAGLMARVKESHDQLIAGVREIQLARKELTAARGDLDRLKSEMQSLRDKVRIAEREYSAILQSMGPLLQQLLESDDISALPPNPSE